MINIIIQTLSAFFATVFFSILFNISKTELLSCGLNGALAWFIYSFTYTIFDTVLLPTFLASIALSVVACLLSKKRKMPVIIYLVAGILPLVPGAGMYRTMYSLLQSDFEKGNYYFVQTLQTAGIIAISTAVTLSMFFKKQNSIYK